MSKRKLANGSLSKNLMQMKFMQKSRLKTLDDSSGSASDLLDKQYNETILIESQKYVINNSYLYCEGLVSGRMSFRGMNPEVEKLMRESLDDHNGDQEKTNESADVSDQEMTDRYSKLISDTRHRKRNNTSHNKHHNKSDKRFRSSYH